MHLCEEQCKDCKEAKKQCCGIGARWQSKITVEGPTFHVCNDHRLWNARGVKHSDFEPFIQPMEEARIG